MKSDGDIMKGDMRSEMRRSKKKNGAEWSGVSNGE